MSVLVTLSKYFYTICGHLADGVETTKDIVQYIAKINYNIVAAVFSFIGCVAEMVGTVVEDILFYINGFVESAVDLFHSISVFVDFVFSFVCKIVMGFYTSVLDLYNSVAGFSSFITNYLFSAVFAVRNVVMWLYDSLAFMFSWSAASCVSSFVAVYMFLAGVGQFFVSIVTGAWQCLGYVLSSIAYFPVYCFECIESLKLKVTNCIVDTVSTMPKETYLVIICLCLMYFTLSNAVRYLSSHGAKLFTTRLRSSRRRRPSGVEWQLDRDFESDFEDLDVNLNYGNVWMIPGTTTDGGHDNNVNYSNSTDSSDNSDSETIDEDDDDDDGDSSDNDEDDDEGSEDGYTVISDDSDSDNSLNSQTLSTESSEHEIEVSLPAVDDHYSLRSRSTTPCSYFPKILDSPEEFEREMEREKDKRKCVVCQDQVKSVLVMPCRHMCLCVLCADQIVRSRNAGRRVCPLCRTRIQKVMNVYV